MKGIQNGGNLKWMTAELIVLFLMTEEENLSDLKVLHSVFLKSHQVYLLLYASHTGIQLLALPKK